jgi:hypothetical protein
VERDADGHIKRSEHANDEFKKSHPCPSTGQTSGPCPGYVIDHVIALKRGGADDPSNMQWQTTATQKPKTRSSKPRADDDSSPDASAGEWND